MSELNLNEFRGVHKNETPEPLTLKDKNELADFLSESIGGASAVGAILEEVDNEVIKKMGYKELPLAGFPFYETGDGQPFKILMLDDGRFQIKYLGQEEADKMDDEFLEKMDQKR